MQQQQGLCARYAKNWFVLICFRMGLYFSFYPEETNLLYILNSDLDRYTKVGDGYCDDGSGLSFPCVYFRSGSVQDCKLACDGLEDCMAFDINNNENCNLRFLSRSLAMKSGVESGLNVWALGCEDNCNTTIVGKKWGDEQGHCYIKNKGIFKHRWGIKT